MFRFHSVQRNSFRLIGLEFNLLYCLSRLATGRDTIKEGGIPLVCLSLPLASLFTRSSFLLNLPILPTFRPSCETDRPP